MDSWIQVILEWINCLDLSETSVKEIRELEDGAFYKKLIELFPWDNRTNCDDSNVVVKFIQDEYPEYNNDDKLSGNKKEIYTVSLLLLHASQIPVFHRPMCCKLQHETQLKIKTFLEMMLPYGKQITKESIHNTIIELTDVVPKSPCSTSKSPFVTPKTRSLREFFNSPISRSTQNSKMLSERSRELRQLKAELEMERIEKSDLQDDLSMQQNKIQNLQKKLQEKIEEIKLLKSENFKPATPQSCKKNKHALHSEEYYKREVDKLQDQLVERQMEIGRLEEENDSLSKKLICTEKQCAVFKGKWQQCERSLESLSIQIEFKDKELLDVKSINEELRTHLKELNKTSVNDQSFEVEGYLRPRVSVLASTKEALSSVVEIQLQEAKEECGRLKTYIESLEEKLENTTQGYNDLKEKNTSLQDEIKMFEKVQTDFKLLSEKFDIVMQENGELKQINRELQEKAIALNKVQIELNDVTEQLDTFAKKNTELKNANIELQTKAKMLNEAEIELNSLNGKLKVITQNCEDLTQTNLALQERVQKLNETEIELERLNRKLNIVTQESEELKQKNSVLQEKTVTLDKVQTEFYSLTGKLNIITKEYEELKQANTILREKVKILDEANAELDSLNGKLMSTTKKCEELTQMNLALQEKVHVLDETEMELKSVNKKLDAVTQKYNRLSEENIVLQEKAETLDKIQTDFASLNKKLRISTDECEKLTQLNTALNDKARTLDEVQAELNSLQEKLYLSDKNKTEQMTVINLCRSMKESLLSKEMLLLQAQKSNSIIQEQLLEKQHLLEQLSIDVKMKEQTLEVLRTKMDAMTKENVASEFKMKEVIANLQEVRSSQDAVLAMQEKALKEKCTCIEELEKEINEAKNVVKDIQTQLENEQTVKKELTEKCIFLDNQCSNQMKDIESLNNDLKQKTEEFNINQEDLKTLNTEKLQLIKLSEELVKTIKDLRVTIKEECPNLQELSEMGDVFDKMPSESNDKFEETVRSFKDIINEVSILQKIILYLYEKNEVAENVLQKERITFEEVNEALQKRLLNFEILQQKRNEYFTCLIKDKESLKDSLLKIVSSRHRLDVALNKIKEKWAHVLQKFQKIFVFDNSMCDELKNLQFKKSQLEDALHKYNISHLQNVQSLTDVLMQKFLWTEQKLQETYLLKVEDGENNLVNLEICETDFSHEKTFIEEELKKNKTIEDEFSKINAEIETFSGLATLYNENTKLGQTHRESENEQKLQIQINQLLKEKKELKEKLDTVRVRNTKLERNLDELRNDMKKIKNENTETSSLPTPELENLKKEIAELKEQNLQLHKEKSELNERPKEEDFEHRLKEVHSKYAQKLQDMKQKMKVAYNDQVTKLNNEQAKAVQEKVEELRMKMEQQCRKHAEEISKYKTHVGELSSQFWGVAEKFLTEQQEKQEALQQLQALKAKFKYELNEQQVQASAQHINPPSGKLDISPDSRQDMKLLKEETVYESKHSVRSIQAIGNPFKTEDEEGEVFDNTYLADMKKGNCIPTNNADRLSILKLRNSMCRPHLKSSYPAEMQFHPLGFNEEDIKTGAVAEDTFNDSLSQSLLPEQKLKKRDRTQTSYKKPGPPTPSKNGGRLSLQGNELRSPNSRILRERNVDRRITTTPRSLKQFFNMKRMDENVSGTPRGRRLSNIFRKMRTTTDR